LAEGRLLVVEPPGVSAERSTTVAAYRLPDAAPLWRTTLSRPLPGTVRLVGITHEVVLVTADPPVNSPSGEADAVALTVGTGTETWWGPLGDAAFTAGGDLLLMDGADGGLRFRSVAARTGAERWSYRLPPEAIWSVGVRRDRAVDLVVGLPSGRVERRSTDTGAVLAAADLPRPARGESGPSWGIEVLGDLLLVSDGRGGQAAYGLDRLDRRWELDLSGNAGGGWPSDCGPVICLGSPPPITIRAVDRRTGRPLWELADWQPYWSVGGYLIAAQETPGAGERGSKAAVDAGSGRVTSRLDGWDLPQPPEGDSRLLGVRYLPDGAWLAELDPATGASRPFGLL
ncbi:PQQ-binding-like beta-propeller repeat protein, partial [Micromonospora zhanjiangensis]